MKTRLASAWRNHAHHPIRAAFGAGLGIAATAMITAATMEPSDATPFIVAPLGASAVLAFAVPASPLAQPRAMIGGNIISALAGVTALRLMHNPIAAIALAVSLSIMGMYLARCLHPPGGGLAMVAVMGGPLIERAGYGFVLMPVAINSILLVIIALIFNNLAGSRYPHRPEPRAEPRPALTELPAGTPDMGTKGKSAFTRAHIDAVLDDLEDLPDISADDLEAILRAVEIRARQAGR